MLKQQSEVLIPNWHRQAVNCSFGLDAEISHEWTDGAGQCTLSVCICLFFSNRYCSEISEKVAGKQARSCTASADPLYHYTSSHQTRPDSCRWHLVWRVWRLIEDVFDAGGIKSNTLAFSNWGAAVWSMAAEQGSPGMFWSIAIDFHGQDNKKNVCDSKGYGVIEGNLTLPGNDGWYINVTGTNFSGYRGKENSIKLKLLDWDLNISIIISEIQLLTQLLFGRSN